MNTNKKLIIILCMIVFTFNISNSYATEKNDSIVKEKQNKVDDETCELDIDFSKIAEATPKIDCGDDKETNKSENEKSSNKKHNESSNKAKN